MPEENDVDKTIYKVNRIPGRKDLYEDIPSHAESEREEDRKGGPRAPMEKRGACGTGPFDLCRRG